MGKRKTTEEFILEARAKHGDKYEYSLVEYVNGTTKVDIYCKKHGAFPQSPSKHLMGRGCRKCNNAKIADRFKLSTEEFISKSILVHGDEYDYSKVKYVNNSTDVIIGCKVHGDFKQRPANHMFGATCLKCSRDKAAIEKTKTKEEFVRDSIKVHGDKYDYSLVKYTNCKDPIDVICKVHGIFETTPDNLLQNKGCPKCSKEANVEKERIKFIENSKHVHGDKYSYEYVDYKTNKDKVVIVCPHHGKYERSPASHLQGLGCDECRKKELSVEKTASFISRSAEIHLGKYNYISVVFVNTDEYVEVICPIHGTFKITPSRHLIGKGCNKCSKEAQIKKLSGNTEDFIKKAKHIHGDTYDYSLVDYVHSRVKVKILCEHHGVFEQKPVNHLKGCGCKGCSSLINVYKKESYAKLSKNSKLYLIKIFKGEEVFYKIGKTKDTVKKRFSNTNIKPYEYELVHQYESDSGSIFDLEIELHKKYNLYKYLPKHKFAGHTECYTLQLSINEIISL